MKTLTWALGALVLCTTAGLATAQDWPRQNVKILVGSSPGGGTDAMARAIADRLGPLLKQAVVVENRAGASNTLAADLTAKSTDGHTMIMGVSTAHAIAPHLLKLNYNNDKDLVPVAFVGSVPNVLVANMALPVTSVDDLVKLARSRPGQLNYATSGSGSTQHIAAEMFKDVTGLFITHIPYRGSSPALVDLMGGAVQISFDTMPSVIGHVRNGKIRPLAVAAAKRNPQMPDVPTMAEAGVKGVEMSAWYGIYMPASTPRDVITRVNAEVNKVIAMPETQARLSAIGADLTPMTPEAFLAFHNAENKRYSDLIRRKNIKLE
ncbi:Bug family tripartite tricarboxylate transporter substrate binding protein [Hydrogenophaga sp. PBL-H3]|uniref:Bug family tripartite tricarboxylate transporter substrate binding protein n=1 Tax=Hydrogenophaga sp. PBL-H3 TaxID=434010 RepID=UPI0013204E4D|nr:tripartite tricarboxylate transporter substrate binding protein [Hydrogenophaga sp. PBL-H3]QHE76192.1 tripartite tricarboxylate transporter substrate binding protein [Hydrogenophaga sp. PBL-H3]QHE80616.1 tripartite tricarboxylate transporter substrate binding protein [Hydrogenophaga sp. PBL-H3]